MTGRGVLRVFMQRPRHIERESLWQIRTDEVLSVVAASGECGRLTPAILSVRNGYCGDCGEVHGEEQIARGDAPNTCRRVEERRANGFEGGGDEFGAEPSA